MLTRFGATQMLEMFAGLEPAGIAWELGLCAVIPTPDTVLADLQEPTIGVNGYARASIARDATGFPAGVTNATTQPRVETEAVTFTPDASTSFDVATNRVFLFQTAPVTGIVLIGPVITAEPVALAASMPVADRTFSLLILGF